MTRTHDLLITNQLLAGLLYPYPFMDLQHLGWGKLLRNAAVLLVLFFLLGCVLVGLGFLVG